ncbi:helix-turn-helix transcriptional regulator [Desulfatibacillum aliphaticivorans]|uniref:helix-turn-helix transcriptional regulator n=1 Tax=Desulfatibacillum aliphaticivorans TaxID=218208 RepID=UPI00048A2E21|nr:helix-turn-helix domain-containing protein [Desulfatibacillum aliphaticivorans]
MEELLTVRQLAKLTGYAEQTVYNKVSKGEFILGRHYYKPTRKKVLFIRAAIQEWLINGSTHKAPGPKKESEQSKQTVEGTKSSPRVIPHQRRIKI